MKKMKKQIKDAFLSIRLPEFNDQLLEKKGNYEYMETEKVHKKRNIWIGSLCTAMFCILVLGGFYYNNHYVIQNTIGIDVNPSIELKINKRNEIREVNANNEDAKKVLQDMDLVGSDMNVAVNALIGSMVQLGYLDDLSNSILISVDGKNSESLRLELLSNLNIGDNYSVVSQDIQDNYSDLASQYNISEGKVQLINQIIESNPLHTFDELASLSINELNLLLGDTDNTVGNASEKAYIGRDNAKTIALKHAGVSEDAISNYKIEMDYDHVLVYEIEFFHDGVEYDYEINAITGEIVEYDQEGKKNPITSSGSSVTTKKTTTTTAKKTTTATSTSDDYIGKERAKEIALKHAGLKESDVRFEKVELDVDYDKTTYEIEFDYNYYEYEYEIDAYTGEILKNEIDR